MVTAAMTLKDAYSLEGVTQWTIVHQTLCPWTSPGKNTGVGCHFLLQGMKVKIESEVASHVRPSATPWTAACQASLSIRKVELAQTHVH